jgi:hypothetical protein
MQDSFWTKGLVIGILLLFVETSVLPSVIGNNVEIGSIEKWIIISPPVPKNTSGSIVDATELLSDNSKDTVLLSNVPASEWTYGCTATAAGMLFGYYDRIGYNSMYTGPDNGGVCPLTNLGQGIGKPIPGSCYIIATKQGLDGISSKGHVDDYWISTNSPGPDPWENHWPEHTWSLCVADFIGTNQWKWDTDNDGIKDSNIDGGTRFWYNRNGLKLFDYVPPDSQGLPQTETGHGCKLFAQSRGYSVTTVYNQLTNTPNGNPNGFTFSDFQGEINAGRPVLTIWTSSSMGHTMLGVGYNSSTNTIYLHDTWDNNLHQCTWTGLYSGYNLGLMGVTIIQLAPLPPNNPPSVPSNPNPSIHSTDVHVNTNLSWVCSDPDGDWLTYDVYFGTQNPPPFVKSVEINMNYDPGKMKYNTTYLWKIIAKDCRGGSTSGPIWNFTTGENQNPNTPTITGMINGTIRTLYFYTIQTTDPYQDNVKYHIDWDDNTTTITGFNKSGEEINVSHTWKTKGTYSVKVKAIDEYYAESDWATLTVTMPYSYHNPILQFLEWLFQRFPQAFPILRQMLGY